MSSRQDKALFLADALEALDQLVENEVEAHKSIFWAKLMRQMLAARGELKSGGRHLNAIANRTVRINVTSNAQLMAQLGKGV